MAAKSIVVVDQLRIFGVDLRNSIAKSGDTAHVFSSFRPALQMLKRKKVDAVVVQFDSGRATREFCNAAKELGVPVVYTSSPIGPLDPRQYSFEITFADLPNSPMLRVHYHGARA
jgi:precorrin-6x reductase